MYLFQWSRVDMEMEWALEFKEFMTGLIFSQAIHPFHNIPHHLQFQSYFILTSEFFVIFIFLTFPDPHPNYMLSNNNMTPDFLMASALFWGNGITRIEYIKVERDGMGEDRKQKWNWRPSLIRLFWALALLYSRKTRSSYEMTSCGEIHRRYNNNPIIL
jgi:hypothetical protein